MGPILLASIAGVAALMAIATGNAANLGGRPVYTAPPARVPIFTWTFWL
jgi:hypothetical protein